MAASPSDQLDDIRILLIQIREAPEVAEHEQVCVVEQTGLRADQIDWINVVDTPDLGWKRIDTADAVVIGGAGAHSAVEDYPFMDLLASHIRRMADERVPLFGSCWGHQFMARVLGGEVIHDESRKEVGTAAVELTDAAADDPVFGHCPSCFQTLMGHEDRVTELPAGAVELAYSPVCRNQAFRLAGKPIYGTQFHSELSPARLIERLSRYRHYMPDDNEFEALKLSLQPTPVASTIMRRFLEVFARRRG